MIAVIDSVTENVENFLFPGDKENCSVAFILFFSFLPVISARISLDLSS